MTRDCHKMDSRTDPLKHPKKAQMPDDGAACSADMFRVFFHRKAVCGLKYLETKLIVESEDWRVFCLNQGYLDLWQQVFCISPARGFVMELKWFEDFLSVSHCYSFTRAASERNITQSALSRRIRQLEEWLGVVLFDRKTYPIRLTPEGEEFLHVAHATVFSMTRLRRSFRAKAHETDVTV